METASAATAARVGSRLFSPILPRGHRSVWAFNELLPPYYPLCALLHGVLFNLLFSTAPEEMNLSSTSTNAKKGYNIWSSTDAEPPAWTLHRWQAVVPHNHLIGRYLPQLYCTQLPFPTSLVCSYTFKANTSVQPSLWAFQCLTSYTLALHILLGSVSANYHIPCGTLHLFAYVQ